MSPRAPVRAVEFLTSNSQYVQSIYFLRRENYKKKSRIQETLNLYTRAESYPDTKPPPN